MPPASVATGRVSLLNGMKNSGPKSGTHSPSIPEGLTIWYGCDAAYIGRGVRWGNEDVAVYDYQKLVQVFIEVGMTEEEAVEWIDFNIAGAYIGEGIPIIVYQHEMEDDE